MSNAEKKRPLPLPAEPVGVIAVGVEGRATIEYLLARGVEEITAVDARRIEGLPAGVETVFGDGYDRDLSRFATIFKSPGIRPDHPSLAIARAGGSIVTSALSYFMERCPCPVVGVTGTVGKGTASSIAARALEASGFTTHLGGNIGKSPLEFIDSVEPGHRVVLEISSFQAMDLSTPPAVGVVLKTTSEHLDWHRDTGEYRSAKAEMLAGQGPSDVVVFNADSHGAAEVARSGEGRKVGFSTAGRLDEGFFTAEGKVVMRRGGRDEILPLDPVSVRLMGAFNMENVLAATAAAIEAGGEIGAVCAAAEAFESLPHRLELAAEGGGVRYYNDSYATRPEAAMAAVGAFDGPLALVMGGSEKNADFSELVGVLRGKRDIVRIGLIGATARRMREAILAEGPVHFGVEIHESLEAAMESGVDSLGEGGGILLMAPACASFGMFPNYKVRGERFRAKAVELAGARGV